MADQGRTHYVGDDCPGGHVDVASCEDFCHERCAFPGVFSECEVGHDG
jgi:hypothetical protein